MSVVLTSGRTARDPGALLDLEAVGRYVLGRRTPQGGYSFYRVPEWNVEEPSAPDTLAALDSLAILRIDPPEPEQTAGWLGGLQDSDGGYPTWTIGWAVLRSLELLGATPRRSPDVWLRSWAEGSGQSEGARDWRAALQDELRLAELLQLSGAAPGASEQKRAAELLVAGRDPLWGWAKRGVELESTAVALCLAMTAGLPWELEAEEARVEELLRACEDESLGLTISPGAGMTSVGAMWGGLWLARALGVRLRHPRAIGASLALLQRLDGGLGDRHRAISTLQATWQGLDAACLLEQLQEEQK